MHFDADGFNWNAKEDIVVQKERKSIMVEHFGALIVNAGAIVTPKLQCFLRVEYHKKGIKQYGN